FSVKVNLIARSQPGPGKLSISSPLLPTVNGALPFTTAAIVDFANSGTSSVTHDQSLIGDGSSATPLVRAPGGVTGADLATGAVTAPKIPAGQVVKSLNGAKDDLSIVGGENIQIVPLVTVVGASPLTTGFLISAPNLITSVTHDATLAGTGA